MMVDKTSFYAEKCCHPVSALAASAAVSDSFPLALLSAVPDP